MWFASEFNSIALPRGNFSLAAPRAFAANRLQPTGALLGDYDLEGLGNRLVQQAYQVEFTIAQCDAQAKMDALMGVARRSGTLKITNNLQTRRCTAKVSAIGWSTTIDDWRARLARISLQFSAEPFWYDDVLTTLAFTSQDYINLRTVNNAGNARAIKHLVLTITTALPGATTIFIEPTGPRYYNEFKYGAQCYGVVSSLVPAPAACQLTYNAATGATLVIDAGRATVQVGGVDAYANTSKPDTQTALLWLDPGPAVVHFSRVVSGSIAWRNCWV